MLLRPLLAFGLFVAAAIPFASRVLAMDAPSVPAASIADKKELLFSDDFQGATHDARRHKGVDTFAFEDGALKGTQTRDKATPEKDGKSTIPAHAAVYGLELPTKNSIVECKIKFDGATMIDVEFDDRSFTG